MIHRCEAATQASDQRISHPCVHLATTSGAAPPQPLPFILSPLYSLCFHFPPSLTFLAAFLVYRRRRRAPCAPAWLFVSPLLVGRLTGRCVCLRDSNQERGGSAPAPLSPADGDSHGCFANGFRILSRQPVFVYSHMAVFCFSPSTGPSAPVASTLRFLIQKHLTIQNSWSLTTPFRSS